MVVVIITTHYLAHFSGYPFGKQFCHQRPVVKISTALPPCWWCWCLLVADVGDQHHHPPSHTLSRVSVWKAILTPKLRSENLKGMAIMLAVLMLLLVGDDGGHHHRPPSQTLSWVLVWKEALKPKLRSERLKGVSSMIVVLMVLLVGDGGGHHHHPPSHTFLGTCLESTPNTKAP